MGRERDIADCCTLHHLCSRYRVFVSGLCLLLEVPWIGLLSVIVIFLVHTHLLLAQT